MPRSPSLQKMNNQMSTPSNRQDRQILEETIRKHKAAQLAHACTDIHRVRDPRPDPVGRSGVGCETRSPSSALLPFLFWGEGSPKIDYRKKKRYPYSILSTGGPRRAAGNKKRGTATSETIPELG